MYPGRTNLDTTAVGQSRWADQCRRVEKAGRPEDEVERYFFEKGEKELQKRGLPVPD